MMGIGDTCTCIMIIFYDVKDDFVLRLLSINGLCCEFTDSFRALSQLGKLSLYASLLS